MQTGELLTRGTIWLALLAGAAGTAVGLCQPSNPLWQSSARWVWTAGCFAYLAHVVCAFHFYYHWSHVAAYQETARQTAAVVGLNWGGGIFFNYVFTATWLAYVVSRWFDSEHHARRSLLLARRWHGFFLFMVLNGAVMFGHGPVRWLGLAICLGLVALWWLYDRKK